MHSITSLLDSAFRSAIRAAFGIDADPLIAPSQNEKFGDYQSNAAMGLVKQVTVKNPRAVAEQIIAKLELSNVGTTSIAGPGFINVRLSATWLQSQLTAMAASDRLGIDPVESSQTVVVDYSGPNIAKEMHVGHLRSTIIGDAIVRVLRFVNGRDDSVIPQNHVGDWGTQFGMLIQYMSEQDKAAGEIADLEGFYRAAKVRFDGDPAFADASRRSVVRLQDGSETERNVWQIIVTETRRHYQPIYRQLNVLLQPADERGESFYNDRLAPVVAELMKNVARESEGAIAIFVEGFETPLIIRKSDGGYLYGTTDLAALQFRITELHATRIIYTHDSRQSQHFAQVFAAARMAGWANGVSLEFAPFGTMLGEDGKPFKTRSGDTVKLKDLLSEAKERAMAVVTAKSPDLSEDRRASIAHAVGIGGVKYADLSKDRVSDYVFSFDKMLAMDGNTAPYLQYAHARIQSILRRAAEQSVTGGELVLTELAELALAKQLLKFGDVLSSVARELKPHVLCNYLYELATTFSGFYENCPVLKSELTVRASRLSLCDLTGRTMARGLDLLGIEHPDEM